MRAAALRSKRGTSGGPCGTPSGKQDAADAGLDRRSAPVRLADDDEGDLLVGSDHEARRIDAHAPGGTGAPVVIAHDGEVDVVLREERADARDVLLQVDADHLE